jgi:phenylacetic acid degradation operon negative regulatory protein
MTTQSEPVLRPVSARSAILTILLGADAPSLTSREICAATTRVGYAEATSRVAASRMVGSGEMVREGRTYTLSPRLLERRRRVDAAVRPEVHDWSGDWELAAITTVGRSPADRAAQRTELTQLGLAELREGLWMRPDNLTRAWPASLDEVCRRMVVRPVEDAPDLAARLWDLDAWAARGHELLQLTGSDDPNTRFTAVAAAVRHLVADPLLPTELLPAPWPGDALRAAYADYRGWLYAHHPTD